MCTATFRSRSVVPNNRPQPHRSGNRRPGAPASGTRGPRPSSARRREPEPVPAPSGGRARLERVSYPALVRLTQAPRWLLAVVTAAVLLGGLFAPTPWGPILLGVVVVFLVWLLALAWPKLNGGARVGRAAVVGALAAVVVAQAAGWL
ncbi:MAG: DUF6703 family protein [Jiangellaceae bacterium]